MTITVLARSYFLTNPGDRVLVRVDTYDAARAKYVGFWHATVDPQPIAMRATETGAPRWQFTVTVDDPRMIEMGVVDAYALLTYASNPCDAWPMACAPLVQESRELEARIAALRAHNDALAKAVGGAPIVDAVERLQATIEGKGNELLAAVTNGRHLPGYRHVASSVTKHRIVNGTATPKERARFVDAVTLAERALRTLQDAVTELTGENPEGPDQGGNTAPQRAGDP